MHREAAELVQQHVTQHEGGRKHVPRIGPYGVYMTEDMA